MTDKVLSDLRRIAQTYPTRGTQDAVIAAVDEIERLRSDLAAARALLRDVHGWLDPWESRQSALRDRIDAAIAGEKK